MCRAHPPERFICYSCFTVFGWLFWMLSDPYLQSENTAGFQESLTSADPLSSYRGTFSGPPRDVWPGQASGWSPPGPSWACPSCVDPQPPVDLWPCNVPDLQPLSLGGQNLFMSFCSAKLQTPGTYCRSDFQPSCLSGDIFIL